MSNKALIKEFTSLPYEKLGSFALNYARERGAKYCDFRFERIQWQSLGLKDALTEKVVESVDIGFGVRLIYDGAWGFASSTNLNEKSVKIAVDNALALAKATSKLKLEPVELVPEPAYDDTHISDYEIDPFTVKLNDKIDRLTHLAKLAQSDKSVNHTSFDVDQVRENKYFTNSQGTSTNQQRIRVQGNLQAVSIDKASGKFTTLRTNAAPAGRGWERFAGQYDYDDEISKLPDLLKEKVAAPSVKPGKYDLVIDPTNLFLTIHESIGHATELDRALGYEANYAGTSFVTTDKLNNLQYGSKLVHVTGDRTAKYGLATIGYDDEGVKSQDWDIIKNGKFVGYQLNRQMAKKLGYIRSNGCAYADSFTHSPLQRMPNVSLKPSSKAISTSDLISRVDNGIYIVGDNSWSIDMQRYNFQFTGQRFYKISNGKLSGQLSDVGYQATTTDFWNSLVGLGGKSTYVLGGAFNCGKGQPGQVAPVSHGCPSAIFSKVNVLNTAKQG